MNKNTFKISLRLLCCYAGIDSENDFQDQLTAFFLTDSGGNGDSENSIKRKISRWIDGQSMPQKNNLDLIGMFFRNRLVQQNKLFIPEWLTMDLSELWAQDEFRDIADKIDLDATTKTNLENQYRALKSYGAYSDRYPKFLRHFWKNISGYYTVQRYHSDGSYIQELLHIHGFEKGTGLSTVHEYSTYRNGIRTFNGNGFVNKESVVFILCSETQDNFYSPEFDIYIIPHDENNPDDYLGVGIGLADTTHNPIAYAFVMTRLRENQVVDVTKYVRVISEQEQKQDKKIMRNIEALNSVMSKKNIPSIVADQRYLHQK